MSRYISKKFTTHEYNKNRLEMSGKKRTDYLEITLFPDEPKKLNYRSRGSFVDPSTTMAARPSSI